MCVCVRSLCVSDLVFCVSVLPFAVARWVHGTWTAGPALCLLVPLLRYGNVGVSLLSIAMISVNRWLLVEHPAWHARAYTRLRTAALVAACWTISYGLQLPALCGWWGRIGYDRHVRTCTILRDERGHSPKTALFVVGFAIPCVVIVGCYARIYWCVRASRLRLARHGQGQGLSASAQTSDRRAEWRVTRMVLAIFVCFLVCYLPITLVKVLDERADYPALHVAGYLLLYASSCLNPLIYVTMNKQYRKAYARALKCGRPSALTPPAQAHTQAGARTTASVVYTSHPQLKLNVSTQPA